MSPAFHHKNLRRAALGALLAAFPLTPAFAHDEPPSTAQKADGPVDPSPSLPIDKSSIDDERTAYIRPDSLDRGIHLYATSSGRDGASIDDSRFKPDASSFADRLIAEGAEPTALPPSADDDDSSDREQRCNGDVTQDGYVNYDDLWSIIRYWGACEASARYCPTDLDDDQQTEFSDLLLVLSGWGQCADTR